MLILSALLLFCLGAGLVWRWWWPLKLAYDASLGRNNTPALTFSWYNPGLQSSRDKKLRGAEFFWPDLVARIMTLRKKSILVTRKDEQHPFVVVTWDKTMSRTRWWLKPTCYLLTVISTGYALYYGLRFPLRIIANLEFKDDIHPYYFIEVDVVSLRAGDKSSYTSLFWITKPNSISGFRKDLVMLLKAQR
ncbi:hypothetical protein ACFL0Z_03325 [Patescibacteria group bacterium]